MFLSFFFAAFVILLSAVYANAQEHRSNQRHDSNQWFHPRDHPVHQLFRRDDATTDGATYPQVGSPAWTAAYPASTPNSAKLPAAWTDALSAAVAAGSIPDIPPSKIAAPNTSPVYPEGYDPTSPKVCSGTYKCRIPGDMWDAPDGYIGMGFDDGPTDDFLEDKNQRVTHFMIGCNMLSQPALLTRAMDLGDDIAVHTWTHPYMTTLSNEDVLAQLGWTLQVIHDSSGGRLSKFWRPPYGDTDVRVSAIAKEVFGLETILWNRDTEDWSLTSGGTTDEAIQNSMTEWLSGPKSPGLIILEHELSTPSVRAFEHAYPLMKSNGWNLLSVTQAVATDGSAYQNAYSIDSGEVTPADVVSGNLTTTSISTASSATTSTSSTTTRSSTSLSRSSSSTLS
ncbi:glycoside hydrolase/deacetylase [Gymnopus androsaceus JB14]|uniref:chitin deacetylase n=1 Tax=Gymnopus androsaceus JB14 TaxID=1447944 RepID=A0A6A4IJ60_9AGAR|nr:glycoside hydrolase/deacetylase [Gymnopus androsaceus JB14]